MKLIASITFRCCGRGTPLRLERSRWQLTLRHRNSGLQFEATGAGSKLIDLCSVELRDREQEVRGGSFLATMCRPPFSLPFAPPISRAGGLLRS